MTKLSRFFLTALGLALLVPVANIQLASSRQVTIIADAPVDTGEGKRIYSERCAICHEAGGMRGPSLKGESSRKNKAEAVAWIKNPRPPMPKLYPSPLSDKDVNDVASYVETFKAAPQASAGKTVADASPPGDATAGKVLYGKNCAACHGATGTEGGAGPSLKGEKSRKDQAAAVAWIKNPTPPMPKLYPSPLSAKDVSDVAAYVETL